MNVISPTHFVLCTPGSAGTMIRAGKPWSIDRSSPLTFSASIESSAAIWSPRQRRAAQHALRLQRLDEHLAARPAAPARSASTRQPHAGPLLRRRPALDARDRQPRRVLRAAPAGPRATAPRPRRRCAAPAGSSGRPCPRVTPAAAARLLTGKSSAPRRQERQRAQRPADRLPDVGHQQRERARAREREQAAARHRRRRRVGATRLARPGSGRVCARSSRSGLSTPRSR